MNINDYYDESKLLYGSFIGLKVNLINYDEVIKKTNINPFFNFNFLNLIEKVSNTLIELFQDIIMIYSSNFNFYLILNDNSIFLNRTKDKFISQIISFITSKILIEWNNFFLNNNLNIPLIFDSFIYFLPSKKILKLFIFQYQELHFNLFFNEIIKNICERKNLNYFEFENNSFQEKNEFLFQNGINISLMNSKLKRGILFLKSIEKKIILIIDLLNDKVLKNLKNEF